MGMLAARGHDHLSLEGLAGAPPQPADALGRHCKQQGHAIQAVAWVGRRVTLRVFRSLLIAAYFLEAGVVLAVTPWSTFWDSNYFAGAVPMGGAILRSNFVRGAVTGGAGAVLVRGRERDLDARDLGRLVARCLAVTHPAAVVVVNDRVDVALAEGAGGVHLRENSVPPAPPRRPPAARRGPGRSVSAR